jgi:hypothetical protein
MKTITIRGLIQYRVRAEIDYKKSRAEYDDVSWKDQVKIGEKPNYSQNGNR